MSLSIVKNLSRQLSQIELEGVASEGQEIEFQTEAEQQIDELAQLSLDNYRSVRKGKAKEFGLKVKELDELVSNAKSKLPQPFGPEDVLKNYTVFPEGLVYVKADGESVWLCDPLEILGLSLDAVGCDQSLVLSFVDSKGTSHRVTVQRADLAGDAHTLFRQLLARGFRYCPERFEMNLLKQYLMYVLPDKTLIMLQKSGWYRGAFVLPASIIGTPEGSDEVVYSPTAQPKGWTQAGSPEEWTEHVAKACVGNSRLVFAVSLAFSAPLLLFAQGDGGGFHTVGSSSIGKTSIMRVANSVWGSPERYQSWLTTANALEATAELHNHSLLCLDELGQANPKEAANIPYMLHSGKGKNRARRDGSAREIRTWDSMQLSNGEIGLEAHIESTGQKARSGQTIRLLDISADVGKGMGIVEELHGHTNSRAFVDDLNHKVGLYYGTAIREYLLVPRLS